MVGMSKANAVGHEMLTSLMTYVLTLNVLYCLRSLIACLFYRAMFVALHVDP